MIFARRDDARVCLPGGIDPSRGSADPHPPGDRRETFPAFSAFIKTDDDSIVSHEAIRYETARLGSTAGLYQLSEDADERDTDCINICREAERRCACVLIGKVSKLFPR